MSYRYFLMIAVLLLGACGHECTAMGCSEGVTLKFAAPLAATGEYTFTLTPDTNTVTCTAFVPLRRDGTEPTCESMSIHREIITTRNDDAIQGRAGDAIVSVSVGGDHDALTLEVTRDGSEVLQAEVTPVYQGVEINGEGCGECLMATYAVGG